MRELEWGYGVIFGFVVGFVDSGFVIKGVDGCVFYLVFERDFFWLLRRFLGGEDCFWYCGKVGLVLDYRVFFWYIVMFEDSRLVIRSIDRCRIC